MVCPWEEVSSGSCYSITLATPPLVYVSMPTSHSLDYHRFIIYFTIMNYECLGYLESLDISHKFYVGFFYFCRTHFWDFDRVYTEMVHHFRVLLIWNNINSIKYSIWWMFFHLCVPSTMFQQSSAVFSIQGFHHLV